MNPLIRTHEHLFGLYKPYHKNTVRRQTSRKEHSKSTLAISTMKQPWKRPMSLRLLLLSHLPLLLSLMTSLPMASRAQPDIVVRMNEEERAGTRVVDVSQYQQLFLEASSPEDRKKLTFNILDQQSYQASFFSIEAATGAINVAKRIDREEVCPNSGDSCPLEFSVAITGTGGLSFSNIASVQINIDDINDNAPSFSVEQVVLEISEGAKVGTRLKLNGPHDLDSFPNNTVQRYVLTPNQQPPVQVFNLSYTKNPDGSSFIYLTLTTVLDRETVGQYDFNIIAYDGGNPPKSAFQRVIVQVTDENDNVPVFQQASYDVSVRQDDPVGSEVVKVIATDRDWGSNGAVRYRFSSVISDSAKRLFSINETSGQITLQAKPAAASSSATNVYNLIVEAFDGGSPPSVEQVVVLVTVLNTGNNAPRVRIVTIGGAATEIPVPESSQVDAFVAFVNADDTDSGDNGRVTCSMVNAANQFRIVELTNKGYRMLLSAAVDRELVPMYHGSILCRDGGTPPLSTQVEFTVVITDINDNAPSFDLVGFAASVTENNSPGQYILQVTATDKDAGNNSRLTYSFVEPDAQNYLSIHPQTGIVTTKVPLDRETTSVLRYTLRAVDGGDTPKAGTAGLTVTVRDMNDNVPQLLGTPYHFRVSEGVSPGQMIGHMSAVDLDEGNNGQVQFFYAGSINGDVPFTVHTNGSIEVNGVLDRETSETHVFTILARDKGDIPRSNSTQVTIKVTDINDNHPVILFPTSINHSVVITTLPESGIILGRIIAYDLDLDNASSLLYSLQHTSDEAGVFTVEAESGKILLADVHKLKNPHIYHVILQVHDKGVPPLSAETSLQIEVNYPNFTDGRAGSGPQSASDEQSRDTYVVIVAVIGGGTVVLSGIIIAAICVVLRQERRRKARERCSVMKNEYVPAPTTVTSPEKLTPQKIFPSAPPPERRNSMSDFSQANFSTSGVILSPRGLPPQTSGRGGAEVQKKVSFSLDEPDADVHQMQARDMLVSSNHHSDQQSEAWRRLASPDDINSDTSGDSGTCDSGRGASDDDIHLDNSMDKHAAVAHHVSPPLTNTNRTPAPANIYSPPAFGSFRQGQGRHGQEQYGGGQGQGQGQASRPDFLHTGSYHEGRADNYRGKGVVGRIQPPPRGYQARHNPQHPQTVSLHPAEPDNWHPQQQQQPQRLQQQQGSSHRSLDFVEGNCSFNDHYANSGRDSTSKWLLQPPRPSSSMSYQRQGSVMSGDDRDDASTTTSGSYTISPEELRLDGLLSPDVIV